MVFNKEAAEKYLQGLQFVSTGFCPDCTDCPDEQNEEVGDEGGFSWSACECCGSSLGGDRYAAHGRIGDAAGEVVHMDVCVDCVEYINFDR